LIYGFKKGFHPHQNLVGGKKKYQDLNHDQ